MSVPAIYWHPGGEQAAQCRVGRCGIGCGRRAALARANTVIVIKRYYQTFLPSPIWPGKIPDNDPPVYGKGPD